MFGTLASRLPTIKGNLALSSGRLGLALLGLAAGALLAFAAAGFLIARFGSRPVTRAAIAAEALALVGVSLAGSLPALIGAMLALGVTNATLDVAMNAHGVAVERRRGRPILSSFHAAWSVGGLLGALIGGLMAGGGIDVRLHFSLVALVRLRRGAGLVVAPAAGRRGHGGRPAVAGPAAAHPGAGGGGGVLLPVRRGRRRRLERGLPARAARHRGGVAAAGYAAFALAMTAGRVAGDRLTERWGPVGLLLRGRPGGGRRLRAGPRPGPPGRPSWASPPWAWGWPRWSRPCSAPAARRPGPRPARASPRSAPWATSACWPAPGDRVPG